MAPPQRWTPPASTPLGGTSTIGRLVYELADYLDRGTYAGFDISAAAIEWLNENYAPSLPRFHFDLVEASNNRYQPHGRHSAAKIRFPYRDRAFDFACAFSVFTHMRLADIANYLRELRRVLTPTGTGVLTFFVILPSDEDPQLPGGRRFVAIGDGVYTTTPELPERAIAYDEHLIRREIEKAGLAISSFELGRWRRAGTQPRPAPHKDVFVVSPEA